MSADVTQKINNKINKSNISVLNLRKQIFIQLKSFLEYLRGIFIENKRMTTIILSLKKTDKLQIERPQN